MATTILVTPNNDMVVTTSENIMQYSKNVHIIRIFVPEKYGEHDMTKFSASVEIVPPNQGYKIINLEPAEITSKEGYIQYDLEMLSEYTMFAGDFSMELTFVYTDTSLAKTFVRHTSSCTIPILAIEKWNSLITDNALSDIDQRLVSMNALLSKYNDIAEAFNKTKADNLAFNEDYDLQLKANGVFIGDAVHVAIPANEDDEDSREDGILNLSEIYEEI